VAFAQSGSTVGIGVIDLASATMSTVIPLPQTATPLAVALSPDETTLFVGTGDGLTVVDLPTQTIVSAFPVGPINAFSRHPTQPLLYGSVNTGSVVEINATTRTIARTFAIGGVVQGTAVSPDGTELYALIEFDGVMRVWNLITNAPKGEVAGGNGFGLGLSPDGKFLYVVGGNVRIYDRASLALLRTVTTGGGPRRVAFDPVTGIAIVTNEGGWVDFIK
jgi:DNA-binding beta-propeller fold protein YncE